MAERFEIGDTVYVEGVIEDKVSTCLGPHYSVTFNDGHKNWFEEKWLLSSIPVLLPHHIDDLIATLQRFKEAQKEVGADG